MANDSKSKESSEKKKNEPVHSESSIEEYVKDGFKSLVEATHQSNCLPQDTDWDYYTTHGSFRRLMTDEGNRILDLINVVMKEQNIHGNIKNRDLDGKLELIIEANDIILERVANNLDELAGIRKNPELPVEIQTVSAPLPVSGSWNRINQSNITIASSSFTPQHANDKRNMTSIQLLTGKNIQRSQKFFKDRIDNSGESPWQPRITQKPNSLKPLAIYLETSETDEAGEIFCHPYEFELDRFEPKEEQLTKVKPVQPKDLSETPLVMIENSEQLDALVEDLRKYHEISVDLEHHSYRTFLGFTCLMQISTGDTDYLIDTLILRDQLWILNEVFTKPTIVKIFHGADNDIEWLQRDLSLYIVNMFDTHQAAKQLNYPHLSLVYLLKKFCQIDANKHFQLADWRIRPLPNQLKKYAREDTHYLIYIYHMMRNELLKAANESPHILKSVIQASTNVCKKRYTKPVLHDDSHLDLYRRCKKLFDNRQMYALKCLYKWRDGTARTEDESIGYVLPNHMMLQIAENLPREMQGILACCNPIPPLVRANLLELHKIILKAREQSVIKPILSEETRSRGSTQKSQKINIDADLNCPHDLSKLEEFRDDLPTLLSGTLKFSEFHSKLNTDEPKIRIFHTKNAVDMEQNCDIREKLQKIKFLGPYERYKLVKPYIRMEEEKNEQKNLEEERTDEDRITSLHEHFKIAATTNPQIQLDTSLNEMRGKKRKRTVSDEDNNDESTISFESKTPPTESPSVPNIKNNKNAKRKRNRNKNQQDKEPPSTAAVDRPKKRNRNRRNWENEANKKQKLDNQPKPETFDYNSVDFRQFQGGASNASQPKNVRSNFKSRGSKNRKNQNIAKTNTRTGTFRGNGSFQSKR